MTDPMMNLRALVENQLLEAATGVDLAPNFYPL